jgi:hypothetical protein
MISSDSLSGRPGPGGYHDIDMMSFTGSTRAGIIAAKTASSA